MADPIEAAAAELRRRIEDRAGELKEHPAFTDIVKWRTALNALEDTLGHPSSSLSALLGIGADGGGEGESGGLAVSVRFDEFYSIPALDGAKRYLKKCKDARPFDEIVTAVKAGGGKIESEDVLRAGLTRSTFDIVKIGERFGAIENYPHVKRGGKKKGAVPAAEESANEVETETEQKDEAVSK